MVEFKRAALPLQIDTKGKNGASGKGRTFQGFASTQDVDYGGDIVLPSAFTNTLAAWRKSGNPIPLVDQHQYDSIRNVLGKMTDAIITGSGLFCTFEIINTPDGDEALARIRGGHVNAMSIGYMAVRRSEPDSAEKARGAQRIIEELTLHEVSLVIFPMQDGARIQPDGEKNQRRRHVDQAALANRISDLLARTNGRQMMSKREAALLANKLEGLQRRRGRI